jgi:hypothetical protein
MAAQPDFVITGLGGKNRAAIATFDRAGCVSGFITGEDLAAIGAGRHGDIPPGTAFGFIHFAQLEFVAIVLGELTFDFHLLIRHMFISNPDSMVRFAFLLANRKCEKSCGLLSNQKVSRAEWLMSHVVSSERAPAANRFPEPCVSLRN